MKVFIVHKGEDYEGGHTIGIYSTRRKAFAAIREYIANDMTGFRYGTKPIKNPDSYIRYWENEHPGEPMKAQYYWHPWVYEGRWSWHSGCDNLSIWEMEVQ